MKFLKSPLATYLGIGIAVFAVVAGVFGFHADFAWTIAGFFGFGSVATLRLYIESKGIKTFVSAGVPMVASFLFFIGVIPTFEIYQDILLVFAPITAAMIQHALKKAA